MSDALTLDGPAVSGLTAANRVERNTVFTELYGDIIRRVAKREHKRATTVSRDDLEQELFGFFYSRMNSIAAFSPAGIEGLAVKAARDIMLRERIDFMHFAGAFIYTPEMVEEYLASAVWRELSDVPDMEGRIDVAMAVSALPIETQRLLLQTYGLDRPYNSKSAEYKRVTRAVETIAYNLNTGAKPGRVSIDEISHAV